MENEKLYIETIECIRRAFSETDNTKRLKAETKLKELCNNNYIITQILTYYSHKLNKPFKFNFGGIKLFK